MPLIESLLQTTKDLVSIPSTADRPVELERTIKHVMEFFQGTPNIFVKNFERAGKPSVVVSTVDSLTPDILLLGHLDVVPAEADMFEPREEDGKLFGRGVCDMKSEDAVMMWLMKEISVWPERPSIALMLTTDEEIGGAHGAAYLINEIGYRCKVALVPDNGQAPDDLILKNKGILDIRLTAKGVAAHGSRPWLGENAIDALIADYDAVQKLFSAYDSEPDRWLNTCNIGVFQGGKATNQVAGLASCSLDIRFIETTKPEELLETIKKSLKHSEVELLIQGDSSFTSANSPFIQLYAQTLQDTLGLTASLNKGHGGHDGRFLTKHGIPAVVSRPLSGEQHGPKEWLDIQSLGEFYRLYEAYVKKIMSVPSI